MELSEDGEKASRIHAEVIARSPNRHHLATPLGFDAQLVVH